MLALGCSDKLVAKKLGISDKTIRKHRENILLKSGCKNICALIYHSLVNEWICLDEILSDNGVFRDDFLNFQF